MKRMIILAMGMLAVVALAGCGKDNLAGSSTSPKPAYDDPVKTVSPLQERLIGAWNAKDGRSSILFMTEGKVEVTVGNGQYSMTVSGAYRISGNRLTLEADPSEKGKDTSLFATYVCAIEAEMLILTTSDARTTRWVRTSPSSADGVSAM